MTDKKIKVYSWSHCSWCWMYYGTFESIEDFDLFIVSNGFDPKYFKTE